MTTEHNNRIKILIYIDWRFSPNNNHNEVCLARLAAAGDPQEVCCKSEMGRFTSLEIWNILWIYHCSSQLQLQLVSNLRSYVLESDRCPWKKDEIRLVHCMFSFDPPTWYPFKPYAVQAEARQFAHLNFPLKSVQISFFSKRACWCYLNQRVCVGIPMNTQQ